MSSSAHRARQSRHVDLQRINDVADIRRLQHATVNMEKDNMCPRLNTSSNVSVDRRAHRAHCVGLAHIWWPRWKLCVARRRGAEHERQPGTQHSGLRVPALTSFLMLANSFHIVHCMHPIVARATTKEKRTALDTRSFRSNSSRSTGLPGMLGTSGRDSSKVPARTWSYTVWSSWRSCGGPATSTL